MMNQSCILSYKCDHNWFFDQHLNQTIQCEQLARNYCLKEYQFVNFYSITYCNMNGAWGGFIPLIFVFIFLIFRFIQLVVEEYLAPSIAYITEWLNLSETMGAVTLLAFANGAGDVVTAIVASTSPKGVSYNIGSLYGSGLLVTTLVVGVTILKAESKEVQLEASSIWRDVGFNIVATIMIIVFGIVGSLVYYDAFSLMGLYVLLVASVFVQEKFFPSEEDEDADDQQTPRNQGYNQQHDDHETRPQQKHRVIARFKKAVFKVKLEILTKKIRNIVLIKRLKKLREKKQKESSFSSMELMDKIFFIIDLPSSYAMKLTMPPTEEEDYSKIGCCVSIAPGIIFIAWIVTKTFYWFFLYALLPVGLLISASIWLTSSNERVPVYYVLLQIYATFGSIVWTYLVSGILIDLLNFVGMLTNLPATYLGLTVIAMGNALSDAVMTIALAKEGHAIMAMTGALNFSFLFIPHFLVLLGLGLSVLRRNLSNQTAIFQLFTNIPENIIMIMLLFTALITLVITFGYGIYSKYLFDKKLAYILIVSYPIFFVTVTIIAFEQAIKPTT